MGETAWGINPIILERIQTAYRDMKGGFCGLPLHDTVTPAPLPPMPCQVFRSEVKNGQLSASVSLCTCASSLTLQALLYAAIDHWGHSQICPPSPPPHPIPHPPPPLVLHVWCPVSFAMSSQHLCRLETVAAHAVIFKCCHVCVSYALACLSACHDFSAVLQLPCHCPCPQRLNPHLEPHLAEEAAAPYWADPLAPATLTALVCGARYSHPITVLDSSHLHCSLSRMAFSLSLAAVSGKYIARCIADTLVSVCHAGHEPSFKRLDDLEI